MISVNLSSPNFSAANSDMKEYYFSLVLDVRFDANAMGCVRLTTFPLGSMLLNLCTSTAPNPSFDLSVVTMNGQPSQSGWCRMGLRNTSLCCAFHHLPSL